MLRRGQALPQDFMDAQGIAAEKGCRVQPQATEELRTENAVGSGCQLRKTFRASYQPEDPLLAKQDDHVFLNARSVIITTLSVEIISLTAQSHLRKQLRAAHKETLRVSLSELKAHAETPWSRRT